MSSGNLSAFFGPGFDPGTVEPMDDYDFLPAGDYPVIIEKAEVKANSKATGHFIEIMMAVLEGKFKNRKIWFRANIDNPSEKAVEISMRTLAALGQAIGVASIVDTSQLLNKACIACVKVKDNQNDVRTFKPMPLQQPQQQAPSAQYGNGVVPAQQPQQQFAPPTAVVNSPVQQYAQPPQLSPAQQTAPMPSQAPVQVQAPAQHTGAAGQQQADAAPPVEPWKR